MSMTTRTDMWGRKKKELKEIEEELTIMVNKLEGDVDSLTTDKVNLENKIETLKEERDEAILRERDLKSMKDFIARGNQLIELATRLGRAPTIEEIEQELKRPPPVYTGITTEGNGNDYIYAKGNYTNTITTGNNIIATGISNNIWNTTTSTTWPIALSGTLADTSWNLGNVQLYEYTEKDPEEPTNARIYHPDGGYRMVKESEIEGYEQQGWELIEYTD